MKTTKKVFMLLDIIEELREENRNLDSQNRKLFNDNKAMHKKIVDLVTDNKSLHQMIQNAESNLPIGSISVTDVEVGE